MTLMAGNSSGATEWLQRAKALRQEQLSKLAQLGVLVNGISQLVHMLQCERGASNVWLCSQGKLYAPECKASRALVDENLTILYGRSAGDGALLSHASPSAQYRAAAQRQH